MRILFLTFAFMIAFPLSGFAQTTGERQIGQTGCKNGSNAADFDTIAQCSSVNTTDGTFQKAPLFVGKVTAPPYTDTTCGSDKAGMLQYIQGTGLQICDGTSWQTIGGNGGSMPTGTVAFFALANCPTGWRLADGTNGTYDLRGEFIRGLDSGRGIDPSRTLGSAQGDAIRNITGKFAGGSARSGGAGNSVAPTGPFAQDSTWCCWAGGSNYGANLSFDASRSVPTANENRPRNIALLACQKN